MVEADLGLLKEYILSIFFIIRRYNSRSGKHATGKSQTDNFSFFALRTTPFSAYPSPLFSLEK